MKKNMSDLISYRPNTTNSFLIPAHITVLHFQHTTTLWHRCIQLLSFPLRSLMITSCTKRDIYWEQVMTCFFTVVWKLYRYLYVLFRIVSTVCELTGSPAGKGSEKHVCNTRSNSRPPCAFHHTFDTVLMPFHWWWHSVPSERLHPLQMSITDSTLVIKCWRMKMPAVTVISVWWILSCCL